MKYHKNGKTSPTKNGRAPQGARGLKSVVIKTWIDSDGSRPARGAWVEIYRGHGRGHHGGGRAPQGARGLKSMYSYFNPNPNGRAPQGARGLKYSTPHYMAESRPSRPARGAWVEIPLCVWRWTTGKNGRAPQGARGLKCLYMCAHLRPQPSRPARGAWVEI